MKYLMKHLLLLLIASINYNLIIANSRIVVGGTAGIALLIYYFFRIRTYYTILLINLVMFIISFIFLPKSTTKSIIVTTFVYPLFIKITSLMPVIDTYRYYLFWIILSGIISGITTGGILKIGCSTGGVNVLIILFKKYFMVPEYISSFLINIVILINSVFLFGLKSLIYSVIVLFINTLLIKIINKNVNHCQTSTLFNG